MLDRQPNPAVVHGLLAARTELACAALGYPLAGRQRRLGTLTANVNKGRKPDATHQQNDQRHDPPWRRRFAPTSRATTRPLSLQLGL